MEQVHQQQTERGNPHPPAMSQPSKVRLKVTHKCRTEKDLQLLHFDRTSIAPARTEADLQLLHHDRPSIAPVFPQLYDSI